MGDPIYVVEHVFNDGSVNTLVFLTKAGVRMHTTQQDFYFKKWGRSTLPWQLDKYEVWEVDGTNYQQLP